MDKILNFQVSLFGRFIDIKPKTDIILKLLTNLQEEAFIPGTVDLAVLDPMTKKITTDSRIQMISQNKAWSIVFLEERIDFNYNFQPDTMSIKKIVDAYEYIKKLIEKVFSVFPDTTGNRIAFNGKILLNEMTDEEVDRFMNKFSSPLSIYNDKKDVQVVNTLNNGLLDLILENKFHGIIIVRNVIVLQKFQRLLIWKMLMKIEY